MHSSPLIYLFNLNHSSCKICCMQILVYNFTRTHGRTDGTEGCDVLRMENELGVPRSCPGRLDYIDATPTLCPVQPQPHGRFAIRDLRALSSSLKHRFMAVDCLTLAVCWCDWWLSVVQVSTCKKWTVILMDKFFTLIRMLSEDSEQNTERDNSWAR